MKVKELRVLSDDELMAKEKALKKELFQLNYERQMGRVEKPARFKNIKIDIARIFTILRERVINNESNTAKTK